MLRNYLASALRNLVRNRMYSVINILGLAVAFAAALLIAVFVRDELSYDRFFPDYQNIYLLGSELHLPGRAVEFPDSTPAELAPLLKTDFPAITALVRIAPGNISLKNGVVENVERMVWADPTVFEIFQFETVAGSLADALTDPDSIVITRKMARKYFGRDDPIGQTLDGGIGLIEVVGGVTRSTLKANVFNVTAVIADLPSNTHLDIEILASSRNANSVTTRIESNPPGPDSWILTSFTYLKLASRAGVDQLQNGLADFMTRYKSGVASPGDSVYVVPVLRPLASLHLAPGRLGIQKPRGNIGTITAVAVIGVLIVIAAAINFVNLTTARAARRAIEVGVRKATGAERRDLMTQFIGEALLYVVTGMGFGLVLAIALLPHLGAFLGHPLGLGLLMDMRAVGFIAAFVVVVGVTAGAYPAFVLASLRPAVVVRGSIRRHGPPRVRQALVVLQYAVLIGLLIPTGVVYRQSQYALTEAQRLDTDQVVLIMGAAPCTAAFKNGLGTILGVRGAACSSSGALGIGSSLGPAKDTSGVYVATEQASVGFGTFEFYGLKPIVGRFFSEAHPADLMPADKDASVQGAVVLNEAAVRHLGFASPLDAVGKTTSLNMKTGSRVEIIGIAPDFAADAVHKVVPPTLYFVSDDYQGILSVRIDGATAPETLAAIDKMWKETGPPHPIVRQFLDQHIALMYQHIKIQGRLLGGFAAAAVAIAGLGVLGLAVFTAEQRTKEIGIRKSMGASRTDILRLILWQFAKPVLWANLIAWPAAYFIMRRWLEGFAYHVDLAPWMFLAASALALIIALLTVIGHALLVARAAPVAALRYE